LKGLGAEIIWPFGRFYVHLVDFMVIWYTHFALIWYTCGLLVYFPRFGMLCQEKSGNPAMTVFRDLTTAI
jgi:hypothetical protein